MTASRGSRRPDVTTVSSWAASSLEALGATAVQVEHIGSTAVPGLAAKPIVDVLVTVEDLTAGEDDLASRLEVGDVAVVVEQDWADMNAYAKGKTDVILATRERARPAAPRSHG